MTARRISIRIAGTFVLVAAAFVGGVTFGDLRAVHDADSLRTVLSLVPSHIEDAMISAARGQDADSSPYDTYSDVLKTLQDNFYGMKCVGGHFGGTGIQASIDKGGHIVVKSVTPSSPAAAANVQPGDVLNKIDGHPLAGLQDVDIDEMLWGEPGSICRLNVTRAGTSMNVDVRRDFIPKQIDTTLMTYNAIRGMVGSVHDRYTEFLDPDDYNDMMSMNSGEFVGIGAVLGTNAGGQVYIVKVLPTGPAMKAKVLAGDIIIKVDDRSTLRMPDTDVVKLIRGQPNTKVALTVLRKDVTKTIVIPRELVQQEVVQYSMIDPARKIGYISLAQFNEESDKQIYKALTDLQAQGMRALIFDLRDNPGGLLDVAQEIASRFIPSGPVVWIKSRSETMDTMEHLDVIPEWHRHILHYPLVVLVDGDSASAAEIVSGAIKDTNSGVLIGEKTFGKGVVQTIMPLPDHSAVKITTQHYYTADKHDINHKGIEPNIEVKFSDDDTRKHYAFQRAHPDAFYDLQYDPQLRRALDELGDKLRVASAGPRPWTD